MKDIPGYEGLYAITSCGKVYSYRNKQFLKTKTKKKGYKTVELSIHSNKRDYYIHRLVAQAYLENPENKKEVNHKDRNKNNNSVNNLEWVSHIENIAHYVRSKL